MSFVRCWEKLKDKMALTHLQLQKLVLPGCMIAFEILCIVLFGLLVEYDDGGQPGHEHDVASELANRTGISEDYILLLDSTRSTTKVYPFFQDIHVMIFVGFGFLMTFLRRYGFSSIGFNMMLAAFAIQWSTITLGLFSFIGQAQDNADRYEIFVSLESLVSSDFAAAAVLITFGAVLGKASPLQLFGIAFFELIFYAANEALNIYVFEAADVGGSMLIHTFGAYFGIACSLMLLRKKAKDNDKNSDVYHSNLFAMIGTLFLWLFWPSFNGALASGNGQYRAIINTYFSMTGSVIATFVVSMLLQGKERKLNMTHVQNATLAGGVAIGSVADMLIGPWAGLFIGFISGVISVIGYVYITPIMEKWLYLQDTCGVHNLHGIPGLLSAIASAVAAGVATSEDTKNGVNYGTSLFLVFPARAPTDEDDLTAEERLLGIETGEGRSAGHQAGFQLALLSSTLMIAIIGGLITGLLVRCSWIPRCVPIDDKELFDDDPFWELPDDADKYLPESTDDTAGEEVEAAHYVPDDETKDPDEMVVILPSENMGLELPKDEEPITGDTVQSSNV